MTWSRSVSLTCLFVVTLILSWTLGGTGISGLGVRCVMLVSMLLTCAFGVIRLVAMVCSVVRGTLVATVLLGLRISVSLL